MCRMQKAFLSVGTRELHYSSEKRGERTASILEGFSAYQKTVPTCQAIVILLFLRYFVRYTDNVYSTVDLTNPIADIQGSTSSRDPAPVKRFVSGGCDNLVKIWAYR